MLHLFLWLQFLVHVMQFPVINVLYFYISASWSVCTVPNMTVFCSSFMSCFPGVFRYFLNDFDIVPVVPYYYWYHFCFCIALIVDVIIIVIILLFSVMLFMKLSDSHTLLKGINEFLPTLPIFLEQHGWNLVHGIST